jgi:hypothetical protein
VGEKKKTKRENEGKKGEKKKKKERKKNEGKESEKKVSRGGNWSRFRAAASQMLGRREKKSSDDHQFCIHHFTAAFVLK